MRCANERSMLLRSVVKDLLLVFRIEALTTHIAALLPR